MNHLEKSSAFENDVEIVNVMQTDRIQLNSSSKGSQLRWYKDNQFIKLDCLGYEGTSEELVSVMLDYTDIPHVNYKKCVIYEDGKLVGKGCYSQNFLKDNEKLYTFASIMKKYSKNYAAFNYDETIDVIYDATKVNVKRYLDQCICVDAITKNEDRYFNNLALVKSFDVFKAAPLFDHGLSCLADEFTYPENTTILENLKHVHAKPFFTDFKRQL